MQQDMFPPESSWKPPLMSELPEWKNARRIAIDLETYDPQLRKLGPGMHRDGHMVGFAFTIEGGPSHYLPIRHKGGDNLPEKEVLKYLRLQAKEFSGEIVGANLGYDIGYCLPDEILFPNVQKFRDIQIADPLIYELHDSYSLKNIGERWGFESKDEKLLEQAAAIYKVHSKAGLHELPARFVGAYAERDTESPLLIYEAQRAKLEELNLWSVFDLESDCLPVLVELRRRGVRIDEEKLAQIVEWSSQEEIEALDLVKRETGVDIGYGQVWKPERLALALEEIGVRVNKTPTGKPNIENKLLESIDHPAAHAIRHARKVNRLRTTFAESISRYLVNGRIHTTFNQIAREDEVGEQKGVRFGRLSSVHPNLQQQPSKDKDPIIAGEWRKIYIPEEGMIWGCLDYKQQEPRWTTSLAAEMDLTRAREAAAKYVQNPLTDNHNLMTEMIYGEEVENMSKQEYKTARNYAKQIFLGLCYGEGGAKLSRALGFDTRWMHTYYESGKYHRDLYDHQYQAKEARLLKQKGYTYEVAGTEGQNILDKFDKEVPFVRELAKMASEMAEKRGYVLTKAGRRLHFPEKANGSFDWTHKALNRIIQGNSADQTKRAMVELHKAGHFIQLQVHDEMDGSFADREEAVAAGKIMTECVQDIVPFAVDVETGPNWGDVK